MPTRRQWLLGTALALGVPILAFLAFFGSVVLSLPASQGLRIKDGQVVGVNDGGAYAWIVPTHMGAVVIDTGLDPEGVVLHQALAGRTVHAVLLTHAHGDHVAALAGFEGSPIVIGAEDLPMLRGASRPKGWIQTLLGPLMRATPYTGAVQPVADGEVLAFGGESFRAVRVPGHTPGSTVYIWRDVAFTGDSLLGHDGGVAPAHWGFADDYAANVASLHHLLAYDFDRIADGHGGVHAGARAQLADFLGVSLPEAAPTLP